MASRKSVEHDVLIFMKNDFVCGIFSHDTSLVTVNPVMWASCEYE